MRVQLVDPSGDVTPYDHALAGALARRGADVELVTSHFLYGPVPAQPGYELSEVFYRRATRMGLGRRRLRRALKLLEHGPDMLRYRGRARRADVRHYQWLPVEPLDALLLPRARPRVLTMHNVLRREGGAGLARRIADRMDAVVVHTRHGARELVQRIGVDGDLIHVIPHGAFEHLTRQPDEAPLPPELAAVEGPVILCFGTVRPYKGIDVLLDAFARVEGAELWIAGRPLGMDLAPLRQLAARAPGRVRFMPRYMSDAELPAYFRRADLLALPHRNVDQSGVLFAGLAFAKPMVLSAVGGFTEVAKDHGVGRLVPPGDPEALAAALMDLLDDDDARAALAERAAAAAAGPYSWDRIAERTLALYAKVGA